MFECMMITHIWKRCLLFVLQVESVWLLTDLLISFRKKVQYFHRASGRFLYEEFYWSLQKPDLRTWITAFAYLFFKWVYHFFPLYIGWFVCFVFVRPVVALIRLLTNECLLLTHITSSPRLAGAEGSPSRGVRGQRGHEWIYLLIVITPYISCIL